MVGHKSKPVLTQHVHRNSHNRRKRRVSNTHGWRRLEPGNSEQGGRCRGRRDRNRPRSRNRIYYYLLVCLLSIMPARAEEGPTVIANPVATSTGSVNNSAVQINQGGYSTQSYEKGHSCNGPTLVLSNYYLGSDTHPHQYHVLRGMEADQPVRPAGWFHP